MNSISIFFLFGTTVFLVLVGATPFAKKRIRARWAKVALVIVGLVGAADCMLNFLRTMYLFSLGYPKMDFLLFFLDGLAAGLFLGLALSGQLFGKKRTEDASLAQQSACT